MTESLVLKIICGNHGAMDYGELADIGFGLQNLKGVFDMVTGNSDVFFMSTLNGNKRIVAKTKVRLCKARECTDCNNLHLCKFYLFGDCRNSWGRRGCTYSHDMTSAHNARVRRENHLQELDRSELCTLLLQNDSTLLPPVCFSYNRGDGEYGSCPDQESCRRLHLCDRYLKGTCRAEVGCPRSHDLFEPHPLKTLQERQVPNELIGSLLPIFKNIQAMKTSGNKQPTHAGHESTTRKAPEKTEICMYFIKSSCKQGDKCWKEHCKLPYKWEVKSGNGWSALPENENIERDFCDPSKDYSHISGAQPVCFTNMTCGAAQVRRLSTVSSVVQPTFILTTTWAWYWEDEYGSWIQYASLQGQHRLSSITCEDLEKKYQEDPKAVVPFTAGSQAYKLSFQDMTQTNEKYGTSRMVRRRPVFISQEGVQKARTSKNRLSHSMKAVPGHWDKSLLPDIGYKKVPLLHSSDEYKKILDLFQKTMVGYRIISMQRIQNRALWEVFQWQRDQMKKHNAGKNASEKLLFHGTDSRHIDAICRENFDWRICGTHGTAYGKGSYFARDAKYSHGYTSSSGAKTMFVCRVLVGSYTKGNSSYLRPPSKDGGDVLFYDSCVDDIHNPSIFVLFEKHQVYPEYLLQYDEDYYKDAWRHSSVSTVTVQPALPKSLPAVKLRSAQSLTAINTNPLSRCSLSLIPVPVPNATLTASSAMSKPEHASTSGASSVYSDPLLSSFTLYGHAQNMHRAASMSPNSVSSSSNSSSLAQISLASTNVSNRASNTSSAIPKPTQAPPPVSPASVILKPTQAPPPISPASVIPKPTQAPPPVSPASVIPKPTQALPPVSPASVILKPTQAPPPVSPASVILKPTQAPPPVSPASVIPKPTQAPPPVSPASVILKPTQAPPPVNPTSVIPKPTQAPPPVNPASGVAGSVQNYIPSGTSMESFVDMQSDLLAFYRTQRDERVFGTFSNRPSASYSSNASSAPRTSTPSSPSSPSLTSAKKSSKDKCLLC